MKTMFGIVAVVVGIGSISGVASANGWKPPPPKTSSSAAGAEKASDEIKTLTKDIATKEGLVAAKQKEAEPLIKVVTDEDKFFQRLPAKPGRPTFAPYVGRWKAFGEKQDKMNALLVQKNDLNADIRKARERISALRKLYPSIK